MKPTRIEALPLCIFNWKKSILAFSLLVCSISVFPVNFQVSEETDAPLEWGGGVPSSVESPTYRNEYSGLVYSPFEAYKNTHAPQPVLYGPGGDPIGGLPIQDGYWLLFFVVLSYSLVIGIKARKRAK